MSVEPTADWYKDAVIYEVHVRAFADGNSDGIGDFGGLTSRLDYLQSLGVTALWLLPFYPSPLRDDGYDIADYHGINPAYGDIRSFTRFLREAHRRDLRVITELVLNHTSDQHPWFQRSRADEPGGRWRDYYVWSDSPERYPEVRVIFEDYETSNWAWDPVAGAYYWHRFFSHQPDLNFDNPEVQDAMLGVVDRWFDLGVDGVRLDAVPYLFERDGTNGENLPETHEYLARLRAHVDRRFPGRMLLAEANQWPEDAAAYFGDPASGRAECHTAFHFPVMPRLYMALKMEDREPIIDILTQTPAIPESCQWVLFLRNHDELTLEMVTDEERDYMYRAYAADPQMRVNVGIRRRLAPLLGNDRRSIELMNVLLMSLPGTPVIYYGDELGMGDNVYLGDRDSLRTPMQWGPGRCAEFSDVNPQQLYLPVIIDPDFHYESVNVEAEERNPASLLWWMRRLITLRQQHPVFGRGDLEFLYPENAKVLAFTRTWQDETVLVVVNLSRLAQHVNLELHEHRGAVPVELLGGTEFPAVGEGPYPITLGPHGWFWFVLDSRRQESRFADVGGGDLPTLRSPDDWHELFVGRARRDLQRALPGYLARNRWYAGRQRVLTGVELLDAVPVHPPRSRPAAYVVLVSAIYTEGEPDTYLLPLSVKSAREAEALLADHPAAGVAWLERADGELQLLHDATVDPSFARATLDALVKKRTFASPSGATLRLTATSQLRRVLAGENLAEIAVQVPAVEQSNSSVVFGSKVVVKTFRRAQEGVNPDLEISSFLTHRRGFPHIAPYLGAIEYVKGRSEPRTVAVATGYVANEGDAWRYTLDALSLFYEHAVRDLEGNHNRLPKHRSPTGLVGIEPPERVAHAIGPYLDSAELLGRRTAELHAALAGGDGDDFEPVPFSSLWQRSRFQAMRAHVRPTMRQITRVLDTLDDETRADAEALLASEERIIATMARLVDHRIDALRIRIHGDLHLGQVLHAGRDFVFIDFEGEPSRPPSERRIKRAALADVAGMVRSFQYAVHAGLLAHEERGLVPTRRIRQAFESRGRLWQTWVTAAYLGGYLDEAQGAPFVPSDPDDLDTLLTVQLLDKALYEVRYDLAHRPDWARIPLRGISQLLEED